MLSQNRSPFPQKKKKLMPWIIVASVILFVVTTIFLSVLWYDGAINKPNSTNNSAKVFVIKTGEGAGSISSRLKEAGLTQNYFALVAYLNIQKLGDKVQAGEYQIPQNLTIKELANILTLGKVVTTKITIPEGWDIEKIGDYLAKNTTITKAQFEASAKYDPNRDKYSFLDGIEAGQTLEGFLYPDTYQLTLKPTANEVVEKMLTNFAQKLTVADRAGIKKSGLTTREVVTLASIVEAEVTAETDRKLVASVFLNRLEIGMPLESDATIEYTLKTGKKRLTYEEVRSPTPYNTYLTAGLPKGPIGNPSIESIQAVIFPASSDYIYFISSGAKTYFAKTLAEHNALVAKYLD